MHKWQKKKIDTADIINTKNTCASKDIHREVKGESTE